MKILFLIVTLTSIACGINTNDSSLQDEHLLSNNLNEVILDCEICVWRDSLYSVEVQIATLQAMEKDYSHLVDSENYYKNILDSLCNIYRQLPEYPKHSYLGPEYIAKEKCLSKYPFDFEKDTTIRNQLFVEYVDYSFYIEFGKLRDDFNRSELNKNESGDYIIKFHGESIFITPSEYDNWWGNVLNKYYKVDEYLENKKENLINQLTGKTYDSFSIYEKVMFKEHVDIFNSTSKVRGGIANADIELTRLLENFAKANRNE